MSALNRTKSIICGDFNVNILEQNFQPIRNFKDVFAEHAFINEINLPTYISPSTNARTSCLDHIWHNFKIPRKSFIIHPNLSDHFATCLVFNKKVSSKLEPLKFRNYSAENIDKFRSAIHDEFSRFLPPSNHVDVYAPYLVNFLSKLQNRYFPIKTKTISQKRIMSPWITPAVLRCIRKKHRWYRLQAQGIITLRCYKEYAADVRKLLREAEKAHYVRRFNSLSGDMKRNWKTLNDLLGKSSRKVLDGFGSEGSSPLTIANEFNEFFVEHPRTIHNNIPVSSSDFISNIPMHPNIMIMHESTRAEASNTIKNLRKKWWSA